LFLLNKPLTTGVSVHLFKSAVVCIFAMGGCDQGQPTHPATTSNPTPVELSESANSIGMEFKLIPAGTYTMGDGTGNEDETPHKVTLTKPFKMGVHEVTQAQYEQVMGVNPSEFKGADHPVEMVSCEDALAFCRRLSELPAEKVAGNVYRLPTEAEWEYACRAGTTTKYSFGDDDSLLGDYARFFGASELGDYAWFLWNSGDATHPVGSKQPNAWGLCGMHGNVVEWCQDRHGDYPVGAVTDPTGATSGYGGVIRGGCWGFPAKQCRSAARGSIDPSLRFSYGGFRVCLSPSDK
jgi:formylglycine-generating enzyme required for sulfatase activity